MTIALAGELSRRDPQQVITALARLKAPLAAKMWLAAANIYRLDPVQEIGSELAAGQKLQATEIADYIAASLPLHCTDGWAYLGRALGALIQGDAPGALHFGYYASLRGAMGLLAAQSVGVFDKRHVVLGSKGKARPIAAAGGTHPFVWNALEVWATSNEAGRRLPTLFRLSGSSLEDWLEEFNPGFDLVSKSTEWQKRWGLNPARLRDDQVLRNRASYRPSEYATGRDTGVRRSTALLDSLWRASEPVSAPFGLLVRHLIRISIEYAAAETGLTGAKYQRAVVETVEAMVPIGDRAGWVSFLLRTTEPDDLLILQLARASSGYGTTSEHAEVIARAFVVLAVSTLVCADLLSTAGLGRRKLAFWWRRLGAERGLWARSAPPKRSEDLWDDVRVALDEVGAWTSKQSSPLPSNSIWRLKLAK